MKAVQVRCPRCGTPIQTKQRDEFFFCSSCGTLHTRKKGTEVIPYEIADLRSSAPGPRYYMPFWRLHCSFVIRSQQVQGGTFHKLASWINGEQSGGDMFIFVPASDVDIATFRHWAVQLTLNNPPYAVRGDFNGIDRIPASVAQAEAIELADFIAITLEAEKPGVMQQLDYTLTVNEAKVVYLPFIQTPSGLLLGT